MEVWLYLALGVFFSVAFVFLMLAAAKRGRLFLAALLGAMGLSTPLAYPLSMIQAGLISLPEGLLIIAGMIGLLAWPAYRAFRSGQRVRQGSMETLT